MVGTEKHPIILVSEQISTSRYGCEREVCASVPRLDYVEINKNIDGTLIGKASRNSRLFLPILYLEKILKLDFLESYSALSKVDKNNAILSTSEKFGLPMAALLSLTKRNNPHILISHHLSSRNKERLFRIWPLYRSFSHFIFVSRPQAQYAIDVLGIDPEKVSFVFDKVDHEFFTPSEHETSDFILAVGNEARDYSTLISAVEDTNLKLVIVASSPWSKYQTSLPSSPNITVLDRISYLELRDLYAQARLIVLPLHDVDYAAGANTTLEAMSMAKPIILSESSGLAGYISHDQTGWIVPPGDPGALQNAILHLWKDPVLRTRLGTNARQAVLERMNFQIYTDHVSEVVLGRPSGQDYKLPSKAEMINVL